MELPKQKRGRAADLPEHISTMHTIDAECPKCQREKLIANNRRIFCYKCGVWWWITDLMGGE